jgi:hypothetical protein
MVATMESISQLKFTPLPPFDFKNSAEWLKWKRRFERFRSASKLNEETN